MFQFAVELNVELSSLSWADDHRDLVNAEHFEIALRPEWDVYGPTAEELANMAKNPTFPDRQTPDETFQRIVEEAHNYQAEHNQDEGEDIRF